MTSSLVLKPTRTMKLHANVGFESVVFNCEVSFERFANRSEVCISTKEFSLPGRKEPSFFFSLHPNENGQTQVKITLKESNVDNLKCIVSSWLMKKDGDMFANQDHELQLERCKEKVFFTEDRSKIIDESNDLLPGGILTFCCGLTFEVESSYQNVMLTSSEKDFKLSENFENKVYVLKNLEKLLATGEHADFTFTIGDRAFKVHRAILHSQSTYFAFMFNSDFKEKTADGTVEIEDVNADHFAELLLYIYTGQVPTVQEGDVSKGIDMLIIADRFQFDSLKVIMEAKLGSEKMLTNETMFTLLLAADSYNAPNLKAKAVEYISSQASSKDILLALFDNQLFVGGGPMGESKSMMGIFQELMKKVKD